MTKKFSLQVLWGCLALVGGVGGVGAVVADRAIPPTVDIFGEAGQIEMPPADSAPYAQFSQPVGTFKGVARITLSFQIQPRLSGSFRYATIAEYSGGNTRRTGLGMLDRKTPMNFGVTYRGWTGMELAGHSLYGSDLGASLTFVLNPKEQRALSGQDSAPVPVKVHEHGATAAQGRAQTLDAVTWSTSDGMGGMFWLRPEGLGMT